MKKILITAFDPFANDLTNSSLEVLKNLNRTVTKLELPTIYNEAFLKIKPHLNYDYIIMLGQAGNRMKLSLERFAQNLDDSSTSDNKNTIKINQQIITDKNLMYQTNIDIDKLYTLINEKNIPVEISNYAGNFVCNNTYYLILNEIYKNNLPLKALFIHIPYLKNLNLELILDGINTIIDALNM